MEAAIITCEYYADIAIKMKTEESWVDFMTYHQLAPSIDNTNNARPQLIIRRALAEFLFFSLRKEWNLVLKCFDRVYYLISQVLTDMRDSLEQILTDIETICTKKVVIDTEEVSTLKTIINWIENANEKLTSPTLSVLASKIAENYKEISTSKIENQLNLTHLNTETNTLESVFHIGGSERIQICDNKQNTIMKAINEFLYEVDIKNMKKEEENEDKLKTIENHFRNKSNFPKNSLRKGKWTVGEEATLINGVNWCGEGRWKYISELNPSLDRFTPAQLKDKWRNLILYRRIERLENDKWVFT